MIGCLGSYLWSGFLLLLPHFILLPTYTLVLWRHLCIPQGNLFTLPTSTDIQHMENTKCCVPGKSRKKQVQKKGQIPPASISSVGVGPVWLNSHKRRQSLIFCLHFTKYTRTNPLWLFLFIVFLRFRKKEQKRAFLFLFFFFPRVDFFFFSCKLNLKNVPGSLPIWQLTEKD